MPALPIASRPSTGCLRRSDRSGPIGRGCGSGLASAFSPLSHRHAIHAVKGQLLQISSILITFAVDDPGDVSVCDIDHLYTATVSVPAAQCRVDEVGQVWR